LSSASQGEGDERVKHGEFGKEAIMLSAMEKETERDDKNK
jgi:hypothetical protein